MQGADNRFDPLLDHVRGHLKERHSVEDLAARACMSPRHFARAFHTETGVTPAKAVERLRVEAARNALDGGAVSVQRVAADCGFGDAERMRRSFARILGMTPSALRRTAANSGAAGLALRGDRHQGV
jgi:transcriptional regulator GlxA family with amidase domain